jgi:hypothetical protein
MSKHSAMSQGDTPLDPETLSEVVGCLEEREMSIIACTPRLAQSGMTNAAVIIRTLAEKVGIDIEYQEQNKRP